MFHFVIVCMRIIIGTSLCERDIVVANAKCMPTTGGGGGSCSRPSSFLSSLQRKIYLNELRTHWLNLFASSSSVVHVVCVCERVAFIVSGQIGRVRSSAADTRGIQHIGTRNKNNKCSSFVNVLFTIAEQLMMPRWRRWRWRRRWRPAEQRLFP